MANKFRFKLVMMIMLLVLSSMPLYPAITVTIKEYWTPNELLKVAKDNEINNVQAITILKEQIISLSLKYDKALQLNYEDLTKQYDNNIINLKQELTVLEKEAIKK